MPAPARSTSIDPISFKDFTPGIADHPGVNYAPETATRANTYRCIANRAGALVPLPRRENPFHLPHVGSTSATEIAVNGLFAPPMGILPTSGAFTVGLYPEHELMVGIEWLDGGNRRHNLYRVRRFETPGTTFDTIRTETFADAASTLTPSGMSFGSTRSNRADNTIVGCPVTLCMWTYGFNHNYLLSWPDDQAQTSASPYMIFTNTQFLLNICCHQGRTVGQQATSYAQGPNTITFMGENLLWSKVNNVGDWTPNADPEVAVHAFPQQFVEENPSGYALMASMSANELFFVKGSGGGYISGDLDNPTVVGVPMITGAELMQHPAVCQLGVVYGNRTSGVWVWPHGDTSQLLSPKMTPDFWVITPGTDLDEFGGVAYKFSRCDDWILAPNNFLFDITLKSWWRLEDETVARFRLMASTAHFMYGSESFYTGASDDVQPPIHFWKRENKTWHYSWQSQPIWQSVGDIVNVNEIELIAEGQGTVTLTLTALNGDTRAVTIQLANRGFPERFREAFSMQGQYLQLRIEADSGNSTSPLYAAPSVYNVTLYPYTEQPIGHSL